MWLLLPPGLNPVMLHKLTEEAESQACHGQVLEQTSLEIVKLTEMSNEVS